HRTEFSVHPYPTSFRESARLACAPQAANNCTGFVDAKRYREKAGRVRVVNGLYDVLVVPDKSMPALVGICVKAHEVAQIIDPHDGGRNAVGNHELNVGAVHILKSLGIAVRHLHVVVHTSSGRFIEAYN